MKYLTSESVLRKELRSVWSPYLEEIGDMYKSEWKSTDPSRWGSRSARWPSSGSYDYVFLLWLSGQVPRQARFLVNICRLTPTACTSGCRVIQWKRLWVGDAGRGPSMQKRMVRVGQMEWAKTGAVLAGVRGHSQNCSVQQVLFHRGREWKRRNFAQKRQNKLNWEQ